MTVVILARDYEAARSAAVDMQLGHDWLHLHKASQVSGMQVARIVLADGWDESPGALDLYQEAASRLVRAGIITDTFTGVLSGTSFVVEAGSADYTPRHATRKDSTRDIILGGIVGGTVGITSALAGILFGWLPW